MIGTKEAFRHQGIIVGNNPSIESKEKDLETTRKENSVKVKVSAKKNGDSAE